MSGWRTAPGWFEPVSYTHLHLDLFLANDNPVAGFNRQTDLTVAGHQRVGRVGGAQRYFDDAVGLDHNRAVGQGMRCLLYTSRCV